MATSDTAPAIRLFDRNDGTFLKPSPSATAEHCIRFWNTVQIPDEIIWQVEAEYRNGRTVEVDQKMRAAMDAWQADWERANPAPRKPRDLEAYQARFRSEYEEYRQSILPSVEASRPDALGEYDSRQLIRAAQMYAHAPADDKFPGESQKVFDERIELFDEVLTVLQIEERYALSRLGHAMDRILPSVRERTLVESAETMQRQLEGIHTALVHLRSDLSD
jgi:hypothetical protein